jgi:hypothetical protein
MRNGPHLAIGLCFVLLGVALLLDRLGLFDVARALHFWPLALVLIGLGMIVQAIRGRTGERSDFPVGAVFVLILIGLFVSHALDGRGTAARSATPDQVRVSAIFSGRRANVQDVFREAHVTSVMGGTVLDLRQATIPDGESAVVDVFALMGGAVLHVPRAWVVDVQSTTIMGGVKDDRVENRTARPRRGRGTPAMDLDEPETTAEVPAVTADMPQGGAVGLPQSPPDRLADDEPLERDDSGAPAKASASGQPPRLIVRGFVLMGGLTIKP